MPDAQIFYLVDKNVLPEVFEKVVQAKQFLAQRKATNLSKAAEMAGISRSALYKYKDCVFSYEDSSDRHIATIYVELIDEPGMLSALLNLFCECGANILTINQNIPVDGVAPVSVSVRTDRLTSDMDAMMEKLQKMNGVVNIKMLKSF